MTRETSAKPVWYRHLDQARAATCVEDDGVECVERCCDARSLPVGWCRPPSHVKKWLFVGEFRTQLLEFASRSGSRYRLRIAVPEEEPHCGCYARRYDDCCTEADQEPDRSHFCRAHQDQDSDHSRDCQRSAHDDPA